MATYTTAYGRPAWSTTRWKDVRSGLSGSAVGPDVGNKDDNAEGTDEDLKLFRGKTL